MRALFGCGEPRPSHAACPNCGQYKGRTRAVQGPSGPSPAAPRVLRAGPSGPRRGTETGTSLTRKVTLG
ncbi:50S ribosomal protein L32 [Streptomyces sp. 184]|uniref:50S ribosomal protein L32 n=1 Tax=Streptomyces sp. 184 TaxID=1827526 RepID=UPI0038929C7B